MIKNNIVSHQAIGRRTSKRKADLVLEIIKGRRPIEGWINTFMEFERQGLKKNPKQVQYKRGADKDIQGEN